MLSTIIALNSRPYPLLSLSLKVNPMVDAYVLNRVDKVGMVCLIFLKKDVILKV